MHEQGRGRALLWARFMLIIVAVTPVDDDALTSMDRPQTCCIPTYARVHLLRSDLAALGKMYECTNVRLYECMPRPDRSQLNATSSFWESGCGSPQYRGNPGGRSPPRFHSSGAPFAASSTGGPVQRRGPESEATLRERASPAPPLPLYSKIADLRKSNGCGGEAWWRGDGHQPEKHSVFI